MDDDEYSVDDDATEWAYEQSLDDIESGFDSDAEEWRPERVKFDELWRAERGYKYRGVGTCDRCHQLIDFFRAGNPFGGVKWLVLNHGTYVNHMRICPPRRGM